MNRYLATVLLLCLPCLGAQCTPSPKPVPPAPDAGPPPAPTPTQPPPDASPPADDCQAAALQAGALGCPLPPSPAGSSWVEVCRNARANAVSMGQLCIVKAPTCAAVQRCLAQ